jgi:hypothetical protein
MTGLVVAGCGLGRRLPAQASSARPGHASQREGVVAG